MRIRTAALAAALLVTTATATTAAADPTIDHVNNPIVGLLNNPTIELSDKRACERPRPSPSVPPLDPAAMRAAIAGLPDADHSGALVRVRGTAGCWDGASGVADVRSGRAVPLNARFRIGSMTKVFTATAALHLAARGDLDLDATVQHYAPGLLPEDYPPVPVRTLLDHTHGLPGVPIDHKDPDWFLAHRFDTWTPRAMFDLAFTERPVEFPPGAKQHYGNIGYLVLGAVIEEVTGRPYAETVHDAVIAPLRLTGTSFPGARTRVPGPHARAYEVRDGRYVDVTEANPTYQWAAAEAISTTEDLDRLLVALITGRLLPPAQNAVLFTVPDVPAYDGDDDPANDVPAHRGGGLDRLAIGPVVFWGKTGDRPGYNNGFGATEDLARRVVFSVNTLHMGVPEQPAVSRRVILAAAGLA
ncbi:serine hydrolase domain-containing protein [Actinokineospora soli]|uniref:Serine hydrolase domain-containing protein n=1 Tax=Actinokineospora soli TaxID=1048753 RepID=A0ABW2TY14_9PSEU